MNEISTRKPARRYANKKAKPVWNALRQWLDGALGQVPPKSLTGKALAYTPAGAEASARLYSLVETAKANGAREL